VLAFLADVADGGGIVRKISLVVLLLAATFMLAQLPGAVPFSGDLTIKSKSGEAMTGKMYFSGSKMRWDMNAKGRESAMLVDFPTQTSYMIMPQQKMYMEMKLGQHAGRGPNLRELRSYDPNNPCAQLTDTTCEKVGTETVNGRSTDKWIFKNSKTGHTTTTYLDKKIRFPIRSTTDNGTQTDLTNVQEGMPSASLFELPSGYKKFDMGAMMGGQRPQGKEDE
jgi:hypothetical protein